MTTPAPGRFRQLRAALIADLGTTFAPIPVEPHFGPFDLAALKTFGARAPVVKVSITGPNQTRARSSGDREADIVVAAYVITKATAGLSADDAALDLAEAVAARIHKKTFGLKFVEPPQDVQIDNLYSGKLGEAAGANLALFSVSWQQLVIFGAATAPDPATLVAAPPGTVIDFGVVDAAGASLLPEG